MQEHDFYLIKKFFTEDNAMKNCILMLSLHQAATINKICKYLLRDFERLRDLRFNPEHGKKTAKAVQKCLLKNAAYPT